MEETYSLSYNKIHIISILEAALGKDVFFYIIHLLSLVQINEKKIYYYDKWIKILELLRMNNIFPFINIKHLYPSLPELTYSQKMGIYELEKIKQYYYFENEFVGFNVEKFYFWNRMKTYDNVHVIFYNMFTHEKDKQLLYDKHMYGLFFKGFHNQIEEHNIRNKYFNSFAKLLNFCEIQGKTIIFVKFE